MPKLTTFGTRMWTAAEDRALRANYGQGLPAARAAVPGRSDTALTQRAHRLGIARKRFWTAAEDRRLEFLWESGWTLAALASRLRRTESGVYRRAQDIGLKLGVPTGYESITAAARRAGFGVEEMVRILERARVRMHGTLSDPCVAGRGSYRHRYVDPEAVDEAVAMWNQTEIVHAAARRRGLVPGTLREWLRVADVLPDRPRASHLRVPSEVIDRVIAERRSA